MARLLKDIVLPDVFSQGSSDPDSILLVPALRVESQC